MPKSAILKASLPSRRRTRILAGLKSRCTIAGLWPWAKAAGRAGAEMRVQQLHDARVLAGAGHVIEQVALALQRASGGAVEAKLQGDRRQLGTVQMDRLPHLAKAALAEQFHQLEIVVGQGL